MYAAASESPAPAKATSLPSSPRAAQALREARAFAPPASAPVSVAAGSERSSSPSSPSSPSADAPRRPLSSLKAAVAESRQSAAASQDNARHGGAAAMPSHMPSHMPSRGRGRLPARGGVCEYGGKPESPRRVVYASAPGFDEAPTNAPSYAAPDSLPSEPSERRLAPAASDAPLSQPVVRGPAWPVWAPEAGDGVFPGAEGCGGPEMITLERSDFRQLVVALRNLREQRAADLLALRTIREVTQRVAHRARTRPTQQPSPPCMNATQQPSPVAFPCMRELASLRPCSPIDGLSLACARSPLLLACTRAVPEARLRGGDARGAAEPPAGGGRSAGGRACARGAVSTRARHVATTKHTARQRCCQDAPDEGPDVSSSTLTGPSCRQPPAASGTDSARVPSAIIPHM
jgi:hypothetical protein